VTGNYKVVSRRTFLIFQAKLANVFYTLYKYILFSDKMRIICFLVSLGELSELLSGQIFRIGIVRYDHLYSPKW